MTSEAPNILMNIDNPTQNEESSSGLCENELKLYPVSANKSGEGRPYAPENWPSPGDNWRWKVGKRTALSGYYVDRYISPPSHLCRPGFATKYASKLSLEHFVRANYPNADIEAFFASFSWKVPSRQVKKGDLKLLKSSVDTAVKPESDAPNNELRCKAGNKLCSSLNAEKMSIQDTMLCDICCTEPAFCIDCCCILCCEKIDVSSDGFSYVKCEANVDGYICGHMSHIECALRAYMAGTVGGSIGLNTEYYCRRCDSRTDLIPHVTKVLQSCAFIDSRSEIKKVLEVCSCLLRGSKRIRVKDLSHQIESAMSKLENGDSLKDLLKNEELSSAVSDLPPCANAAIKSTKNKASKHCEIESPQLSSKFDLRVESIKLEEEVDAVLEALKKSQETEYWLASEKLSAQKRYVLNLYQQLDRDRSNLTRNTSPEYTDSLLDCILNRVSRIKDEITKLKEMAEVAKGFGRVNKRTLEEHFGL